MSQDEYQGPAGPEFDIGQRVELEEGNDDPLAARGIGTLLRQEREKRGLSYSDVNEITRLRPFILEALENEDWDSLPSPGFVTGFVRSYARALGLDQDEMVGIYRRIVPLPDTVPRPPVVPAGSRKKFLVPILVALVLLSAASAYYIWREYTTGAGEPVSVETRRPLGDRAGKRRVTQQGLDKTEPVVLVQEEATAAVPEEPSAEEGEGVLKDEARDEQKMLAGPDTSSSPPVGPGEGDDAGLVLKGVVREKTWVRIFVDDQGPKDYIFRAGSEPEWRAKEGFELLIGNAGGIELELNGKMIQDLGSRGQVVRLRLPKEKE